MTGSVVELRAARIPVIGFLAHHHWFVVQRGEGRDRWEVWQHPDAGGQSWGHVHKNLLAPDSGVGNGPSWVIARWEADAAESLAERLEGSIGVYPWCDTYRYWPGPNSNTYAQWILAGRLALGAKALGKRYGKAGG